MTEPRDYFDINKEPNVFNGRFAADPSEAQSARVDGSQDEISTVRDMIANEPAFTGKLEQAHLGAWLQQKRAQCSVAGNLALTFLAAIVAGPFAVIGVFFAGSQTTYGLLYMILFAPVIEELLKQSGMVYLLEKKPYRIFSAWQFIAAAIISSLIFSAVENLLYIHWYTRGAPFTDRQGYIFFRWTVCTLLHVTCSVIASVGLINVWQRQLADSRAADLAFAFRYFAIAMAVHGLYNLVVSLIDLVF
ncbi:MAG: PrsW family intramembrane metalloprotease [Planctomycetaceae bacterium]|nr:PrsW family intramembrane metalloprotease [Planctomycetaceae bacterium]